MKQTRILELSCLNLVLLALVALVATQPIIAQTRPEPMIEELEADQEPEDKAAPRVRRIDLRVSVGSNYDDNILHLRDEALDDFNSGDFAPDRFLIESTDDTILSPSVDLAFSLTPDSRKRSRFRVVGNIYRYRDNSIKNFERYRFLFEQDLSDARDDLNDMKMSGGSAKTTRFRSERAFRLANRTRFRLGYGYAPARYLGEITDDDFGGRTSAYAASNGWDARYYQRLNRGVSSRWSLLFRYANDTLDYNAELDERDSTRDRYALGLNYYTLAKNAYWQFAATYELADRNSNVDLIGISGPSGSIQDDLSYDGQSVTLFMGRYWYREKSGRSLYKRNDLTFSVSFGNKDYNTSNLVDLSHFGRNDDYYSADLIHSFAINNQTTLRGFARYSAQKTNLDPIFGLDRFEPSDFSNVIIGIQINIYTNWKFKALLG